MCRPRRRPVLVRRRTIILLHYYNTIKLDYYNDNCRYDDASSLAPKYALARRLGLRGVGPFTFTDVARR